MKKIKLNLLVLLLVIAYIFTGCTAMVKENNNDSSYEELPEYSSDIDDEIKIDEYGSYTLPEDVALYIHTYNKIPSNYITKREAIDLGWDSDKGNLWEVTDNQSIGGDLFGNREGKLPKKDGRKWYECDVNYKGGYRGAERIVYSNDGLIYYTDDHYETFTQLY